MPASLHDLINELEEWLKDVDDTLESEPVGPLPEPVQQYVLHRLHSVGHVIDQILDPNTPPNLPPADAGSADTDVTAVTPREYAHVTLQLARTAKGEMESGDPDYAVIRMCLKTIKYLLPPFEHSVVAAR